MDQMFKVPIRNLFCLLSYVNDMPELIESLNDVDEDLITYDFIVNQFIKEVEWLHRRGFVKDYVEKQEVTNRLAGRMLINESIPYLVGRKPVLVCEKDEYSPDILLNQVMKSTLQSICVNRYVKKETRKKSFMQLDYLHEVGEIQLTKKVFSQIYFGRQNVHYKRMIHLAMMLFELSLLSHKQGKWSLFSAELDEKALNGIFEKFLFHFYRIEQKDYRVSSEVLMWRLEGNTSFLPQMKTDVSLTHQNGVEKIIIDAKFYKNAFQENFGKSTFHSHNMYQLFTYLMHQKKELQLRGILIYPTNGTVIDEKYQWSENVWMEVMTVDLDGSWKEIHRRLMAVVDEEHGTKKNEIQAKIDEIFESVSIYPEFTDEVIRITEYEWGQEIEDFRVEYYVGRRKYVFHYPDELDVPLEGYEVSDDKLEQLENEVNYIKRMMERGIGAKEYYPLTEIKGNIGGI
jgi:5-methylcytosine-specific restriction enzyme subunit McrC